MAVGNNLREQMLQFPSPVLRAGSPAPPVVLDPTMGPVSGLLDQIHPIAAPIQDPTLGPDAGMQAQQARERLLNLATPQDLHASLIQHVQDGTIHPAHYDSIMQNLAGRLAARHAVSDLLAHDPTAAAGSERSPLPLSGQAAATHNVALWIARHPAAVRAGNLPVWAQQGSSNNAAPASGAY